MKLPVHHGPSDGRAGLDAIKEMVNDARATLGESIDVMIEGEPLPENGVIEVPDSPGFGVELNRETIVPLD